MNMKWFCCFLFKDQIKSYKTSDKREKREGRQRDRARGERGERVGEREGVEKRYLIE